MSFIRDMMNTFGWTKVEPTATHVEMEITARISDLLDQMNADDVPWLDRIAKLNSMVEEEIIKFNEMPGIEETERFEAIKCIRTLVSQLIFSLRRCHLLASRK